jgi:uncharacterized protein (TIGR00730 family)
MQGLYRVAIFGSARIQPGDEEYQDVFQIARGLALAGFDIVTGGGPGLMEAANAGHKASGSSSRSIGLNIKLPFENEANKFLDINREFDRFSNRLDTFMSLSDAIVVAPGGVGTLLEFFYSWQLMQVEHICETPIVMFGDLWTPLIDWLRTEVMQRGLFDERDMQSIFCLDSVDKVVALISKAQEDRNRMKHICVNYDKYRFQWER